MGRCEDHRQEDARKQLEDEAAASESKARRERDKRRSAIEQGQRRGGYGLLRIESSGSLEGGHVLEVGEESGLRVGEGERWRRRVIRSTIRRAGAFEKMGRGRGGEDLKHNNNLFGNDDTSPPCRMSPPLPKTELQQGH
mmetsp:Transcript_1058/g.2570  ORF Transcript_1058/g.2570 Transcript_1058/m.2570 type:complete len:139 (-) Transcript_1058:58-474(-)